MLNLKNLTSIRQECVLCGDSSFTLMNQRFLMTTRALSSTCFSCGNDRYRSSLSRQNPNSYEVWIFLNIIYGFYVFSRIFVSYLKCVSGYKETTVYVFLLLNKIIFINSDYMHINYTSMFWVQHKQMFSYFRYFTNFRR